MTKKMQEITPEEINENFEKFTGFLQKLEDTPDRKGAALQMCDELGERLALCPASGRLDYHNCFPGGLVEHSNRVLGNGLRLRKQFSSVEMVPTSSLIIGCLFHDLGKVGDLTDDYYIPQDSDWHRDKLGEFYKVNTEMKYMTVPHRSVFLCQHFGLRLTHDEMVAILIHDGQYVDDNKSYKMKEPALADIVHLADYLAGKEEKGMLV